MGVFGPPKLLSLGEIMKKVLIIRYGAYGDCIIITPILRALKEQGYYIVMNTSDRGKDILANNPHVDEWIFHDKKGLDADALNEHWEELEKKVGADVTINFTGSIEQSLALHPVDPLYNLPKNGRKERCNKNYYEATVDWANKKAGFTVIPDGINILPELFFTEEEHKEAQSYIKEGKFNILWAMSGSGRNKTYPWSEYVMGDVLNKYDDVHFITVGDERCQMLEARTENITNLAGSVTMRMSCLLTKYADLVISPDTGVLHASGCYTTPKIGLLGHTTKTNITETFLNDYSVEANCACAPCFRLIYDYTIQCPIDEITRASWCMAIGLEPERVLDAIETVIGR